MFINLLQKLSFSLLAGWFICLLALGYGKSALGQGEIKIAVASSLLPPMQQVKQLYELSFNSKLILIPGSSGKLTAQITNGAPYDVYLSADMKYLHKIQKLGFAANSPEVLLHGSLVLWVRDKATLEPKNWLAQNLVKSIAIAQPELAPYGLLAQQYLKAEQAYEMLKRKMVFGESIGQVNQYIRSGAVDAAFTAASAMHSDQLKDVGYWKVLDIHDLPELEHGMVLTTNATADRITIDQFVEFIKSPVAASVFKNFGFNTL